MAGGLLSGGVEMKPEQFLRKVLGESGFYCVLASRGNHRPQELYDSVDTVVARARERDAAGYDSYFALATLIWIAAPVKNTQTSTKL